MSFSGRINRLDGWKLVDAWDSTYWEGGDVHIYFNDVEVTEAIQLTYQVGEEARPYYGYADYIPRKITPGSRIISGEFTINFKRAESILAILQYISKPSQLSRNESPIKNDTAVRSELKSFENGYRSMQSMSADNIHKLVKATNRTKNTPSILPMGAFTNYTVRHSTTDGFFGTSQFDIKILYGLDNPAGNQMKFIADNSYAVGGYVADMTYARNNSNRTAATGKLISGARITLNTQTVDDSGRPLVETYNFIAADYQPIYLEGN